jgi:signal transduction histidine kinase
MSDGQIGPAQPSPANALVERWLRPLGLTTVTAVVAVSLVGRPSPALSGGGLAVAIALIVLVGSYAALQRTRGGWGEMLALAATVAASATLVWAQSGGPGLAGLFVAAAYAASRLSPSRSLAILALALGAYAAASAHADRSAGLVAAAELGLLAFYVLAAFARRVRHAQEHTERLLAELRQSRRSHEEAAALRERSRIAREIHDVLAHSLSGLMLQLEGARMLAGMPNSNGQLPEALQRAHDLAHTGLQEARRAIGALRDEQPPGVDRLSALAEEFSRDSQIPAMLEVTGTPRELDAQTSLTLFRVAQEALTNVRKHGRPERVELGLAYEPGGTRLVVCDHDRQATIALAKNSSATRGRSGYGLTGMRERAELLGGTLLAQPTPEGFRVELWIPA